MPPTSDFQPPHAGNSRGTISEVFLAFLVMGLTSFGGPIAHLGYFRKEFVERRRWLDDHSYADLVALCQFLPGPASSQVGMVLGLGRAGWPGMFAAWAGFTLPSASVLILFAYGITGYAELAASGWVHGLKLAAVAIVAQAVWGMAKSLCPDPLRAFVAVGGALLGLAVPGVAGQVAALILAGFVGWWHVPLRPIQAGVAPRWPVSPKLGVAAFVLFVVLLIGLPVWATATGSSAASLVEAVYRAGALVFGGGHVVLPLLQAGVVPGGFVTEAEFLAGYGAAQAVPGPLFTFAAYIGAVAEGQMTGWWGGMVLLLVIFVPGALVLIAALPFWEALRHRPGVQRIMAGVNAGVVGLLLAALYDPVWTTAVQGRADFGLALAAFALLVFGRVPPALVVLLAAVGGGILAV